MVRFPLALLLLALVACATPEERCLRRAQPDTAAIDAQIAEIRTALANGYRVKPGTSVTLGLGFCQSSGNASLCLGGSKALPPKTVPIDRPYEQARLAALEDRRAEIIVASERAMRACYTGG